MKILFTLMLVHFFSNAFGQIQYQKEVHDQYVSFYKKLSRPLQNESDKIDKDTLGHSGLAIFTEFKCDTLNKVDYPKDTHSNIYFLDPKTHRPSKSTSKKDKYSTLPCNGRLYNDTLGIIMSGLFLDQVIINVIKTNHVTVLYFESHRGDYIFKEKMNDTLTETIGVPTKISQFILSDSTYKAGDIIYGLAEIVTNSYYQKDEWDENHFLNIRWKIKYYFIPTVQDNW